MYLHLLRLYLSTADDQPLLSFAEENDQNALETNLAAAFRLLGEQANRIDTVQVFYSFFFFTKCKNISVLAYRHQSYFLSEFMVSLVRFSFTIYCPLVCMELIHF